VKYAQEIAQAKTMQIATAVAGKPWICTVYFVLHGGSLYWLSFPTRRHSQQLQDSAMAAVAIVLDPNVPVAGIQAEGVVSVVSLQDEVAAVLELYVKKYNKGVDFAERFAEGKNEHWLYKCTPERVVAFDERFDHFHGEISLREDI
jgi:hypothetical protein